MPRLRVEEPRGRAVTVVESLLSLEEMCRGTRRAGRMGVRRGMTKAEMDSFDGLVDSHARESLAIRYGRSADGGLDPWTGLLPGAKRPRFSGGGGVRGVGSV